MTVRMDMSQALALSAGLGRVSHGIVDEVDAAAKKGAENVKEDLRSQAESSPHFRGMAGSISYDRSPSFRGVAYEIGPDKGRRGGALGNIFFFGGAHGGGGTGDLDGPLQAESPRFQKALGDVIESRVTGL